jgi:hypothetical protein
MDMLKRKQDHILGYVITAAVSHRLPATEAAFAVRTVHVEFVVDKVALGQDFLCNESYFLCQYNSTDVSYLFMYGWGGTVGPLMATVQQRHSFTPL